MRYFKKFLLIFSIIFFYHNIVLADTPYFLDFKLILNESEAGKKAQKYLKNKLENGIKNLKSKEKKLLEEEKKIISQKKILAPEEYKKKVSDLRSKVSKLQQDRNTLLETVAKQRSKARNELLKNLNPLIQEYMNEKRLEW